MPPRFQVAREEGTRQGTFFYHIEDGYQYHLSSERPGTMYFKCVRYERGCRGRAFLDDMDGFVHTAQHNHDPDLLYPEEMDVKRRILKRCRDLDYTPFTQIIHEELRGAHQDVRARIFIARMRTSMRNARLSNYPFVPDDIRSLTEILMNRRYGVITMTEDGQDNIYAGSVTDTLGGHHVLFMSLRMMEVARNLRALHGDGTFKVTPAGLDLEQVYCIVGVWRHHNVALGIALMESRRQVAYVAVLGLLRERLGPDVHFTKVITDFETGQQNAWQEVFQIRVQGCLWHACRRFLITAQELGLTIPMREIHEVKRIIRLCMALPLLPGNQMRTGLVVIIQEARDEGNYIHQLVEPFLRYIWTSWLRSDRTCSRLTVYGSSQRTNNTCESHNRALREAVGIHPNIYTFIAGIVKMEQRTHDMVIALNQGRRVGRGRRRTAVINDDRIRQLAIDLMDRPGPLNQAILRFLRAASAVMGGMIEEAMR